MAAASVTEPGADRCPQPMLVVGGLLVVLDQHGGLIMTVELVALAIFTFSAMALDSVRSRQSQTPGASEPRNPAGGNP